MTEAFRALIYGEGGVGKTSLACSAPGAVVLSGEGGHRGCGMKRVLAFDEKGQREIPQSWNDVLFASRKVAREGLRDDERTLVIDGLTGIEELAIEHTLSTSRNKQGEKLKSMSDDYCAGDAVLLDVWREWIRIIENIWMGGINIIMVAHERRVIKHHPADGDTPFVVPALNTGNRGNISERMYNWADIVGRLHVETEVTGKFGLDKKNAKPIHTSNGKRVLTVKDTGRAYKAKVRPWMSAVDQDIEIPAPPANGWAAVAWQIQNGTAIRETAEKLTSDSRWLASATLSQIAQFIKEKGAA